MSNSRNSSSNNNSNLYKVVANGSKFQIVNTKTGSINRNRFSSRAAARLHVQKLLTWHRYNKTPAGLKRTARWNKYLASRSRKSK